jgi:GTP-binding protein
LDFISLKICTSYKAGNGGDGSGDRSTGLMEMINLSTARNCSQRQRNYEILFEITEDGEKQVLSRGGKGGLGNWHFKFN